MNPKPNSPERSGIVFDIQRCSMYDGPGIRTTIFLKGCPLSCKWCHNPESQKPKPQLAYFAEKCTGCRTCMVMNPKVHLWESEMDSALPFHKVLYENCTLCGRCIRSCPSGALKIYGQHMTIDEIMEIIKKDIPYYRETDGGITVSGGEPLFQFSFLLPLLTEAKRNGISTCIETSGYAPAANFEKIMPYTDVFLFDYKETSPEKHFDFTGVDSKQILSNLDFLYHNGKRIILRCPIIPGFNDTAEHFSGIAKMEQRYPNLEGIEILPYHDLGKTKALAIGSSYHVQAATTDNAIKDNWKKLMFTCGCSMKICESF